MAWFRTESEICSRDGRRIASGPGSVADVLERATSEGVNLSGADLRGQDLSRRSLVHARLECADLAGANLSHADLSRAVLEEANLAGVKWWNLQRSSRSCCRSKTYLDSEWNKRS